ncbi:rCG24295 [Rattus norvegicus]|uniref:RCG24295 n=1 Tax=Rattus norvegicus TaxID=10116 RepID=A6KAI6_RAT|nr:rCG24295 [Rattus norvegicus]
MHSALSSFLWWLYGLGKSSCLNNMQFTAKASCKAQLQ